MYSLKEVDRKPQKIFDSHNRVVFRKTQCLQELNFEIPRFDKNFCNNFTARRRCADVCVSLLILTI